MHWNYKIEHFKEQKVKGNGEKSLVLWVCGSPMLVRVCWRIHHLSQIPCLVAHPATSYSWSCPAWWMINSSYFPWFSFIHGKHWLCRELVTAYTVNAHPHIPASASLCLRAFFFFFLPREHSIHWKGRWEWQRMNALQGATLNSDWWKLVSK